MRTASLAGDKRGGSYYTNPKPQFLTDCPRCPRKGILVSPYAPEHAECDNCHLRFPLQAAPSQQQQQQQLQRVERQESWGGEGQQRMQAPSGGASWTTTCGSLPPNSTFSVTYTLTTDQYGYVLPPAHLSSPLTAAAPPSCWITSADSSDDEDDSDDNDDGRAASGSSSGSAGPTSRTRLEEIQYQDALHTIARWHISSR